MVTHWT